MPQHLYLLRNDKDTMLSGIFNSIDLDRRAIHIDLTGVFCVNTGDYFQKCRFSCAVFTAECMDPAGTQLQPDLIEHHVSVKRFCNILGT